MDDHYVNPQAETLPTDENIFIGLPKEGIEKVGFGLWWRSCSIFYLEVTEELF